MTSSHTRRQTGGSATNHSALSSTARPPNGSSTTGASGIFAGAVIGSNVCQVGWLAAADHVMSIDAFGAVLAAQAMYAVLQIVIDSGTAYHGARLAASGELTSDHREDLVRSRLLLALVCIPVAVVVAALGSTDFLAATIPYLAALLLMAVLNWWEPYGHGRVGPYAGYLFGRSAGLMIVAGTLYVVGRKFPVELAGIIECGVLVIIMMTFRLWPAGPHGLRPSRQAPWRSVFDIGLPAVVSQYNFAACVVILGLAGQNTAAATVAVGGRLLSGMLGLNGALSSGLFPRLARGSAWDESDQRAAGLALALVTTASCVALALTTFGAPLLVRAFLHTGIPGGLTAVMVMMTACAATTMTLHLTSVLVASRFERLIRTAALSGALLITAGAVAASIGGHLEAVTIAVVTFLAAQIITALVLVVHTRRRTLFPRAQLQRALALMLAVSGLGLIGGLNTTARVPTAIALSAIAIVAGRSSAATALRVATARLRLARTKPGTPTH